MSITTISSRDFNRDTARAKRATTEGPVFITDRGRPAHVLLSFDQYRSMTASRRSLVDALSMPGLADIPFDLPASRDLARPADLD